jgi:hypothetical protein
MANDLTSNTVKNLARIFTEKVEGSRVVTKTVDTQLLTPRLTPRSGGDVTFKRPTDFNSIRTPGGDISSATKSEIIVGSTTGAVQNYITVATEWENVEEALELDQLDELLMPMATRAITDLEVDLGKYMVKNANLSYGTPGTSITKWSDVASSGALMQTLGVPTDAERYFLMNPFATTSLADTQSGLASGDNRLVTSAWQKAQIDRNFGGMQAITSNALTSYTTGVTTADRVGALSATPDATYVTHKDTMIQSLALSGFTGAAALKAGEIITVTGRNRINLSTKEPAFDGAGAQILWSGVITADVTLSGGAGTILVAGAAINEVNGQYNTVSSALASGDVVTVSGADATTYQPSMFYHKKAYGLGFVKLPKLFSTDTVTKSEDGFSLRVSKYADGDSNTQKVRFDILPAYITFNPFFAGQGFGTP